MFDRTYYATHPDMMECVSNDELRDRYLIQDLFRDGECVLNYTHAERFVIGGVAVSSGSVKLLVVALPPPALAGGGIADLRPVFAHRGTCRPLRRLCTRNSRTSPSSSPATMTATWS